MIKKLFDTNASTAKQKTSYRKKDGEALKTHMMTHDGIFDRSCVACKELLTFIEDPAIIESMQWTRVIPAVECRTRWFCNSCKFGYHNCGSPKCNCSDCARKRALKSTGLTIGIPKKEQE